MAALNVANNIVRGAANIVQAYVDGGDLPDVVGHTSHDDGQVRCAHKHPQCHVLTTRSIVYNHCLPSCIHTGARGRNAGGGKLCV